MKRISFAALILAVSLFVSCNKEQDVVPIVQPPHPSGGNGTPDDPWKIASVEDLQAVSDSTATASSSFSSQCFLQVCDIDFGGAELISICRNSEFTGTYDGGGHTITSVKIVNPEKQPLGFISKVGPAGVVKNIIFENAQVVSSNTRVGTAVGYLHSGTVEGCRVDKNCVVKQLSSKTHELGGIVGSTAGAAKILTCICSAKISGPCGNVGAIAGTINAATSLEKCTATSDCTVEGGNSTTDSGCNVAGIVGYVSGTASYSGSARVMDCKSSATVKGHWCDNGGIVGRLNNGTVAGCEFDGTISCDFNDSQLVIATQTSHSNTGGIVGWVSGNNSELRDCKSSAKITTTSRCVGGVLGFIDKGNVHHCTFENGSVEAAAYTGGIAGYLYYYGVASCSVVNSSVKSNFGYGGGVAGYNYASMVSDCHFGKGSKLTGGGQSRHRYGGIAGEAYGYAAIVKECSIAGEIAPAGGIVGGAVGYLDYGLVRNTVLKETAVVTSTNFNYIGGMVAQITSHGGYVIECTTEKGAKVYGKDGCQYIGGMVGSLEGDGRVCDCHVNVDIKNSSSAAPAGGIVGYVNSKQALVINCLYYDGTLTRESGAAEVSGIVGKIVSTSSVSAIVNCAAYPKTAGEGVAGICADPGSASVINCYSPIDGGAEKSVAALNDGAQAYNNAGPRQAYRACRWVVGTNEKPVQVGSPIATEDPGTGKIRVALMGDSISCYTGWTPYPKGNGYPQTKWPDVTSVDQVYWHILIYDKMKDCELDVNSSYSGSCVMETTTYGYPGRGFLHRYTDLKNPDIIFINGGTNDCTYASGSLPVGKLNFDLPDDQLNVYTFAGAYDMLIRKLREKFPEAKIGLICGDVPNRNSPACKQVILDIAEHYGLPCAVVSFPNLSDYTEDNTHPNAVGHAFMADTVWAQFQGKF